MSSYNSDPRRDHAADLVRAALGDPRQRPVVKSIFEEATFTVSHVVRDAGSDVCAILDSVLDYDLTSGRTSRASADPIIDYIKSEGLTVQWLLETHAYADHLSATPYLPESRTIDRPLVGGGVPVGLGWGPAPPVPRPDAGGPGRRRRADLRLRRRPCGRHGALLPDARRKSLNQKRS